MGYTTTFDGFFTFNKPLNADQIAYLKEFAKLRRCRINRKFFKKLSDPLREKVGLPIGVEGEFCITQPDITWDDVTDVNRPPLTQPDLWSKWEPTDDGTKLIWNGKEKFEGYTDWLIYYIRNFFIPWGYVLNGEMKYEGEDKEDKGILIFKDNTLYDKCYIFKREDYTNDDGEESCKSTIIGEKEPELLYEFKWRLKDN